MSKLRSLESIRREYESIFPIACQMRDALKVEIEQALVSNAIKLVIPIETRIKSLSSIVAKIGRGDVDVKKLSRLRDLVGLRLVVLFTQELGLIDEVIKQIFDVTNQKNLGAELDHDRFGYKSTHYVVKMPPHLRDLPHFEGNIGLVAEIQVRTLAQHIWAVASHKLQYKREESIPPSVRRPLYRVAALLETADLEFDRVLEERTQYSQLAVQEPDDAMLNVDNMTAVLRDRLPQGVWIEDYAFEELLEDLNHFSINTRGDLLNLINFWSKPELKAEATLDVSVLSASLHPKEYDEPDDCYMEGDYSPGAEILNMLQQEFGDRFMQHMHEKAVEAFRDVSIEDYA